MCKEKRFAAAFLALLLSVAAAGPATADVTVSKPSDRVVFTIVTTKGYVRFAAGADWTVLTMQSRLPNTASVFQIPDPADQGTPDSTNIIISLHSPGDPKADQAIAKIGASYGGPVQQEVYKDWTVFRQSADQRSTPYTILDAKATCGDVVCGVRLAWPHLANHSADYDGKMEMLFHDVLDSVTAGIGTYQPRDDEVVRRPE